MIESAIETNFITYVLSFNDNAARMLHERCDLSMLDYRVLCCLSDCPEGLQPSRLACILETSPASITLSTEKLERRKLIVRTPEGAQHPHLVLTPEGRVSSRTGDRALASAYQNYFSALSPGQRAMVGVGCAMMNRGSGEGNRIRNGRFFLAYETLHAFLCIERNLAVMAKRMGMSLSCLRVLLEAARATQPCCPHSLSQRLLLSPSNLSHALDCLESERLVQRVDAPKDKRKTLVVMTDKGGDAAKDCLALLQEALAGFARNASAQELKVYRDTITATVDRMSAGKATRSRTGPSQRP